MFIAILHFALHEVGSLVSRLSCMVDLDWFMQLGHSSKYLCFPESVTGGLVKVVYHLVMGEIECHVSGDRSADRVIRIAHKSFLPLNLTYLAGMARLGKGSPCMYHVSGLCVQLGLCLDLSQHEQVNEVLCVAHAHPPGAADHVGGTHQSVRIEVRLGRYSGELFREENSRTDNMIISPGIADCSPVTQRKCVSDSVYVKLGGSVT